MKILLPSDQVSGCTASCKLAKHYLEDDEDTELIVLYVSTGQTSFYNHTSNSVQLAVSDKELQFVYELEASFNREFAPWKRRARFRHEVGQPTSVILQVAAQERIDQIILGTPKHSFAGVVPLRSVTFGVLTKSQVPVVVAP